MITKLKHEKLLKTNMQHQIVVYYVRDTIFKFDVIGKHHIFLT